MSEYDGPGAYENAYPEHDPLADDERDRLREAIRRGLRTADAEHWGAELDPGQIDDYVEGVVQSLLGEATDHPGWLILGGLGHVYRIKDGKMTDATDPDFSVWTIRTRNER